eukprot:scaffold47114_cov35-Phaeocystis_antarctica.AAC.1
MVAPRSAGRQPGGCPASLPPTGGALSNKSSRGTLPAGRPAAGPPPDGDTSAGRPSIVRADGWLSLPSGRASSPPSPRGAPRTRASTPTQRARAAAPGGGSGEVRGAAAECGAAACRDPKCSSTSAART